MPQIPETVIEAWESRTSPAVFATCDQHGTPNVIYTLFVNLLDEDSFVIVDHYFDKTLHNIEQGSSGSLVFLSPDGRGSYQVKGSLEYHQDDELHEQIKASMPPTLPTRGAVVLKVESVFNGSEQLC